MNNKIPKFAVLRHKGRKYPQITIKFDDKSEKAITIHADLKTAQKILYKIKREIALGEFDIDKYTNKGLGITLKELFNRFVEHRERLVHLGQLSPKTLDHNIFSLDLLIEKFDPDTKLQNFTNDDATNFMVMLKDSRTSRGKVFKPGAINSYLRDIKAAFNWAVKEKLISENPFQDVSKLPNPNEKMFRHISEEDIGKIREYLREKPEWQLDIFNLYLWTGARRSEIFNIKKQSLYVDVIKGEKIPFARLTGKGNKTRNMPLCAQACEVLNKRIKYLEDPTKQFEIVDKSKGPTQDKNVQMSRLKQGYLFWEIIDSSSITKAFARARHAIGLEYFNVHSLRHSFATYCLKDEVPVTTVKEFLGHEDITTTMIYTKVDDELKARDIKKIKPR
ncbi:MAG: tyrosine-type recombinase/integrase [Bacteroidales bacterium]|nr:tyrosine-type recombinase/integrase [Bacteroidales bacterium]